MKNVNNERNEMGKSTFRLTQIWVEDARKLETKTKRERERIRETKIVWNANKNRS